MRFCYRRAFSPAFSFTSSLRYGAGSDGTGLVADLGAAYSAPIAAQLRLGMGAGLSYANAAYQQSFFGVTASQAAASGYPVYTPGAGLRQGRAYLALTYTASPRVFATAGIATQVLTGDAADSPLVQNRSSTHGLLAVTYGF